MQARDVDVLIAGRGIGGLSAALHSAVEGYKTLAIGPDAGQLYGSTMVENYAGYARIAGRVLLAAMRDQAMAQGAEVEEGSILARLDEDGEGHHFVETTLGLIHARVVILALGVRWTRASCPVTNALADAGRETGVVYGSPYGLEGNNKVIIVGAGNGGGQAALYLADRGSNVDIIARRPLSHTMSSYLLKRIERSGDRIQVLKTGFDACTEREGRVKSVLTTTGEELPCSSVALFLGGRPIVPPGFPVNDAGFVPTRGVSDFETPVGGIYAVGDCRDGSFGRAAAASGEAAAAVALIGRRQLSHKWQDLPSLESEDYKPHLTKEKERHILQVDQSERGAA